MTQSAPPSPIPLISIGPTSSGDEAIVWIATLYYTVIYLHAFHFVVISCMQGHL